MRTAQDVKQRVSLLINSEKSLESIAWDISKERWVFQLSSKQNADDLLFCQNSCERKQSVHENEATALKYSPKIFFRIHEMFLSLEMNWISFSERPIIFEEPVDSLWVSADLFCLRIDHR